MIVYYLLSGTINNIDTNFQFSIDEDIVNGVKCFSTRLFRITKKNEEVKNSIIEKNEPYKEILNLLENQENLEDCFVNLKKYLDACNIKFINKENMTDHLSDEIDIEFTNFINSNFK